MARKLNPILLIAVLAVGAAACGSKPYDPQPVQPTRSTRACPKVAQSSEEQEVASLGYAKHGEMCEQGRPPGSIWFATQPNGHAYTLAIRNGKVDTIAAGDQTFHSRKPGPFAVTWCEAGEKGTVENRVQKAQQAVDEAAGAPDADFAMQSDGSPPSKIFEGLTCRRQYFNFG